MYIHDVPGYCSEMVPAYSMSENKKKMSYKHKLTNALLKYHNRNTK